MPVQTLAKCCREIGLGCRDLQLGEKVGGARRDRTADLLHAMQALSQLSYGPIRRESQQPVIRRSGSVRLLRDDC
jgi:hypothetical protein